MYIEQGTYKNKWYFSYDEVNVMNFDEAAMKVRRGRKGIIETIPRAGKSSKIRTSPLI